jgi:3-hydroxyacyl-[acyl-carrier-protein] dehydratase
LATAERVFPADHPAALGHFPGNPVIPGALLLAETLRAIASGTGARLSPCRIRSAKFLAPVRPGDRVVIEFGDPVAGAIRFTCQRGGQPVLKGEVACGAASTVT